MVVLLNIDCASQLKVRGMEMPVALAAPNHGAVIKFPT
jgi:hypothetical protein